MKPLAAIPGTFDEVLRAEEVAERRAANRFLIPFVGAGAFQFAAGFELDLPHPEYYSPMVGLGLAIMLWVLGGFFLAIAARNWTRRRPIE